MSLPGYFNIFACEGNIELNFCTMITLFEYAWFPNFFDRVEELKLMAMEEDWDNKKNPTGKYPILVNYIKHTFIKLCEEDKIVGQEDYSVFNVGLATPLQEEIFALFQRNRKAGASQQWYFIGWRKQSDRDLLKFGSLPDCANYFDNASDLIYDTNLELRLNVNHIVEDNIGRFPARLQEMDRYQLGILLEGTIRDAVRRVKRNYKTAVPQYYNGKLQLLLPLCLTSRASADLALVVERQNDIYRASTCLTLDMAINNARLIAKPDDEWLKV